MYKIIANERAEINSDLFVSCNLIFSLEQSSKIKWWDKIPHHFNGIF